MQILSWIFRYKLRGCRCTSNSIFQNKMCSFGFVNAGNSIINPILAPVDNPQHCAVLETGIQSQGLKEAEEHSADKRLNT